MRPGAALLATVMGLLLAAAPLYLAHPAAWLGLWLAQAPLGLAAGWWLGTRERDDALLRDAVVLWLLWTALFAGAAVLLAAPLLLVPTAAGLVRPLLAGAAAGLGLFAVWRAWPAFALIYREGSDLAGLRTAIRDNDDFGARSLLIAAPIAALAAGAVLLAWPGLLPPAVRDAGMAVLVGVAGLVPWLVARHGEPAPFAPVAETDLSLLEIVDEGGDAPAGLESEARVALETRLYFAARVGRVDDALALLEAGADPHAAPAPDGRDQRTLPMLAAVHSDLRLLRALIAAGVELNHSHAGLTPLLAATRDSWHGRAEAVMTLLANGADPRIADADGLTPLHHAARSTDPGVAALLIDAGAPLDAIDREGLNPLGTACAAGNWRLARFLLERGARPEPADGQPALLAAAGGEDDPAGVQLLLRHKARVDARDREDRTALLIACRAGNAEVVEVLLAAGADRNARDAQGQTPLLEAAASGHLPTLRALAATRPDPAVADALGRNALAQLARAPQFEAETVAVLRELGVDPEQADAEGLRPLQHAVAAGRWGLVAALDPAYPLPASVAESADGAPVAERTPEALFDEALALHRLDEAAAVLPLLAPDPELAARRVLAHAGAPDLAIFDWLLAHGAPLDDPRLAGNALLFRLLDGGPALRPALRRLLERGAGVGGRGGLARFLGACGETDAQGEALALELLERGADAFGSDDGREAPLLLAIRRGWPRLSAALLERGADPNLRDARGRSPLHLACLAGDESLVRRLVRHGASPEARAPDGQTPLGLAIAAGRRDLVRWLEWPQWRLPGRALRPHDLPAAAIVGDAEAVERLLELGLPLDGRDAQGCTALLRAAGGGHAELVRLLLARGADVGQAAHTGATPLSAAVSMRHPTIVDALIEAGAAVDQALPGGLTPLMVAAALGLPAMAQRLLAAGADVRARDDQGLQPLHCAAAHVFQARDGDAALRLLDVLLAAGAEPDAVADGGLTPLLLALGTRAEPGATCDEDGVLAAVERLLAADVSLAPQDRRGFAPLHLAALHGLSAVVRRLLRAGADPRQRDTLNRTPHDIAVLRGFVDVAAEFEPARPQNVSLARFLREPPRE